MVSRGGVGLIVAGVGVSSGALINDIYTAVIIMVAATSIITPIWLKISYKNEPLEPAASTKADPIH
jgi:Kef-type K+ transport system membrane component KefB